MPHAIFMPAPEGIARPAVLLTNSKAPKLATAELWLGVTNPSFRRFSRKTTWSPPRQRPPDVFIFRNHSGRDVITDFHDGEDAISLASDKGVEDFSALKGHIAQAGNDAVLPLLDGDHVTQKADLDASDFIF